MKRKSLLGFLCLLCLSVVIVLFASPYTVNADEEKKFITQPQSAVLEVDYAKNVTWETNFVADEFNIVYYDVNGACWDQWDIQAYGEGVNDYDFQWGEEESILFKIQALIGGECVLESETFTITWTNKPIVSYLPNGGSGSMQVSIVENGKIELPYCSFQAPEGKRFAGWEINGQTYSMFADFYTNKSAVAIAVWKTVVNLPIVIDGSYLAGKKSPDKAKLGVLLQDTDQYYFCDGSCCGAEQESDVWYESDTNEKATTFIDGKLYYYRVGIHPRSGYILPEPHEIEDKDNDIIQVDGVFWLSSNGYVHGQENIDRNSYWVDFIIKYDVKQGIPSVDGKKVISEITIDGSSLVGKKTPVVIPTKKIDSKYYYACTENCECENELDMAGNIWMNMMGENEDSVATTFEDKGVYVYYLILHAKDGYAFDKEASISVTNVTWVESQTVVAGEICVFMGAIVYDEQTGIPGTKPSDPESLPAGAIIGIVAGSVVVVGVGGFALVWFVIKKKTWAEFVAIFKKKK